MKHLIFILMCLFFFSCNDGDSLTGSGNSSGSKITEESAHIIDSIFAGYAKIIDNSGDTLNLYKYDTTYTIDTNVVENGYLKVDTTIETTLLPYRKIILLPDTLLIMNDTIYKNGNLPSFYWTSYFKDCSTEIFINHDPFKYPPIIIDEQLVYKWEVTTYTYDLIFTGDSLIGYDLSGEVYGLLNPDSILIYDFDSLGIDIISEYGSNGVIHMSPRQYHEKIYWFN